MRNDQQVLHSPFDIETHKKTFINYLEVIVAEDGTVMYAVPSHQRKLIAMACEKLDVTEERLHELVPQEYHFDVMDWLMEITGAVAIWNDFMQGFANEKQQKAIQELADAGLFRGIILTPEMNFRRGES